MRVVETPTPIRWKKALEALACFRQHYAPADMPGLAIEAWSIGGKAVPGRPRKRSQGVYLLFDEAEQIRYVGVAMWSFAKRIPTHDFPCRYADVIRFEPRWLPLALTLEYVLIQKMGKLQNKTYSEYGLHCDHDPIPRPAKDANG